MKWTELDWTMNNKGPTDAFAAAAAVQPSAWFIVCIMFRLGSCTNVCNIQFSGINDYVYFKQLFIQRKWLGGMIRWNRDSFVIQSDAWTAFNWINVQWPECVNSPAVGQCANITAVIENHNQHYASTWEFILFRYISLLFCLQVNRMKYLPGIDAEDITQPRSVEYTFRLY